MTTDLAGREILVCVTGGIAAYKVCEVVSKLVQAGAGVTVSGFVRMQLGEMHKGGEGA